MLRRMMGGLAVALSTACTHVEASDARQAVDPAAATVPADASPEELLSRMTGRWVLTGVIAGDSTVHDVEGAYVLNDSYVRLTEVSREKGDNGQPLYEAIVYVGWAKDHYVCFWLDNTEVASVDVSCRAPYAPDAIPLEFRGPDGTLIFTNVFTYDRKADTWRWLMSNVGDGKTAVFGDVSLQRR
jgi:hypothetical protein